jgi:hypothetical protein
MRQDADVRYVNVRGGRTSIRYPKAAQRRGHYVSTGHRCMQQPGCLRETAKSINRHLRYDRIIEREVASYYVGNQCGFSGRKQGAAHRCGQSNVGQPVQPSRWALKSRGRRPAWNQVTKLTMSKTGRATCSLSARA